MTNVGQLKLSQTIERITEAICIEKELNPQINFTYPCSICNKKVLNNQPAIVCDTCEKYCHIKCDGTSREKYEYYQTTNNDSTVKWHCLYCTMKFHHDTIPFTLTDTFELEKINQSDNMKFCQYLPTLNSVNLTHELPDFPNQDEDDELPNHLNSKYYSVYEFQKLKVQNNFNIFHSNVNGLELKHGTLNSFLSGVTSAIDVVAITETSEDSTNSFTSNVSIDGYKPYFTATNSSKGGTAIYVKEIFDVFERMDLKSQTDDYESLWVEIKNKRSKNIVCARLD